MIFIWLLFLWLTSYIRVVRANTEIINFGVTDSVPSVDLMGDEWPSAVLTHGDNQRQFEVLPAPLGTIASSMCENEKNCLHEVWIALDLTHSDWSKYDRFTLRISWPGSSSADFWIDLYRVADDRSETLSSNRVRFARIRLVDTGVLAPTASDVGVTPLSVPFDVILEPLLLGLVPASLAPTIGALLLVALAGFAVFRVINRYFNGLATEARKELSLLNRRD